MNIFGVEIPAITILIFLVTLSMIISEAKVSRNFKMIQIVGLITIYTFWEKTRDLAFTQEIIAFLVVSALTGLLFGTARSVSMKLYYSECRDTIFSKGTALSASIFAFGFIVNLFLKNGFVKLHAQEASIIAVGQALHVLVSMICVKASLLYQAKHKKNIPVTEKCG